jgi:hypothetical protein
MSNRQAQNSVQQPRAQSNNQVDKLIQNVNTRLPKLSKRLIYNIYKADHDLLKLAKKVVSGNTKNGTPERTIENIFAKLMPDDEDEDDEDEEDDDSVEFVLFGCSVFVTYDYDHESPESFRVTYNGLELTVTPSEVSFGNLVTPCDDDTYNTMVKTLIAVSVLLINQLKWDILQIKYKDVFEDYTFKAIATMYLDPRANPPQRPPIPQIQDSEKLLTYISNYNHQQKYRMKIDAILSTVVYQILLSKSKQVEVIVNSGYQERFGWIKVSGGGIQVVIEESRKSIELVAESMEYINANKDILRVMFSAMIHALRTYLNKPLDFTQFYYKRFSPEPFVKLLIETFEWQGQTAGAKSTPKKKEYHIYKGRKHTIHTGTQGGKYIISNSKKVYINPTQKNHTP